MIAQAVARMPDQGAWIAGQVAPQPRKGKAA
jgi:hypothetical protein